MSITIRGIPNIDKAQVTLKKKLSYTSNGGYQLSDEWFLNGGVNLIDALLNEYVDETKQRPMILTRYWRSLVLKQQEIVLSMSLIRLLKNSV